MSEGRTRKILRDLYDNVTKIQSKEGFLLPTSYQIFKKNCLDLREKWEEAQKASETLTYMKMAPELDKLPAKLKSMVKMLAYLGLVESLGVTLVDMILVLLIANGKAVHTRWPVAKHVTEVKELEKIELAYKLDFLKAEKLGFFVNFINRNLRNHIAHLKFRIEENGNIKRKDKKQSPIDIDNEIRRFWKGANALMQIFSEIGYSNILMNGE